MPKYSFVIPVYKAEKYLPECIESVLSQTFQDLEIVLVEDGSPDNSGKMCDDYAEKYSNIIAIHQKNQGASVARNTGLDNCNGDYVIFLDSDDFWCDNQGLEKVDRLFEKDVDLVIFPSKGYKERTQEYSDDRYDYQVDILNSMTSEECLSYLIAHDRFNIHPGKRAYRKEFLIKNQLYFKPNIKSEDIDYGIKVANALPVYRFLNERLYVYRHHDGSVTHSIDEKHLQNYISIIREFAAFQYVNESVKNDMLSYLAYQLALLLAFVEYVNPDNKKEYYTEIKKYAYLFKYKNYPRTKKIALFYQVAGFHITRFVLGKYLKGRF